MILVLLSVYGHHEVQVLDERRYRFTPYIDTSPNNSLTFCERLFASQSKAIVTMTL